MHDRGSKSWTDRAFAPVDIASLAVFRVLFGVLVCGSMIRFLANGWVEQFFVEPQYFFTYWGFGWVRVLPPAWMTAAFVIMAVLGAMIALGLFFRVATVAFVLLFTYVELIDVTNYLNHYYLVSLLGLLLAFTPAHRAWSLDARRRPELRSETTPALAVWILRFQVGVVYVFAALAKASTDWLVHAQPLNIWMSARSDTPIVGPWLDSPEVALVMGWAGFLNDLLAPFLLLNRRTRPYAFVMILGFHAMTGIFFNIGIFPILMPLCALIFFEPSWPRTLVARFRRAQPPSQEPARTASRAPRVRRALVSLALCYALVQVAMPLRAHIYPGNVLWSEEGMRWSWRVMCREKNGDITYFARLRDEDRTIIVPPRRYLTDQQEREFSGQPDLILQLAHTIGEDLRAQGHDPEVRVEAWVSLNGRSPALLIDPDVDLLDIRDGLAPADWILPAPEGPPPRLRVQPQRNAIASHDTP